MIGVESFQMLRIEPADAALHSKILEVAPRECLPLLTNDEINEIEYLRERYDALIGIINPVEAGLDFADCADDRKNHPAWIDTEVCEAQDQSAFICTHTSISEGKVATYLYCIVVEEAACGLLCDPISSSVLPIEEMIDLLRDEHASVIVLLAGH